MGCFNISGFYSHLPIKAGDKVGAILCANMHTVYEGLPIETVGLGIYPMMAPVYGEYDDYAGIENVVETETTRLFKDLTGIDFTDFIEMNHRNSKVSVNTKDNGNEIDDIPGYQSIISKFVPSHYWIRPYEDIINDIEKAKNAGDDETVKFYEDELVHDKLTEASLKCATYIIIYEHESVLTQLKSIGYKHMNCDWYGTVLNADRDYDTMAAFADKHNGCIFKLLEIGKNNNKAMQNAIKEAENMAGDKLSTFIKEKWDERDIDLEMEAIKAEPAVLRNWMTFQDYFCAIYKNMLVSYAALKDDILGLIYIDRGLCNMHGYYCPSKYASQDIYYKELLAMHNIFSNIIGNTYDSAVDIEDDDDDE